MAAGLSRGAGLHSSSDLVLPDAGEPFGNLSDLTKGVILAVSSSVFIGSSFIVKKKGLRLAGSSGLRAGIGGYTYLTEPLWWAGMLTMVVGEVANFAAYAFAPAIVVTPLGALSIIVSAALAHIMLNEKLNIFGMLGCMLCIVGSITIVLHAPEERDIVSLLQVWQLAMQPAFLLYVLAATAVTVFLICYVAPTYGVSTIFVYVGICSVVGSLSVMSCKALGIAIKLTFQGQNQFVYPQMYYCMAVVAVCVVTQMNYLNKALDLFNTAIVSPIYYVMFTVCTIAASVILFQDAQSTQQVLTQLCGFLTIVAGTFLLHATRDLEISLAGLGALARANLAATDSHAARGLGGRVSAAEMAPLRTVVSGDAFSMRTPSARDATHRLEDTGW